MKTKKAKRVKISVTGHQRATAWLAHKPEEPPLKEVRKQIRIEIEMMVNSYKESDGVIRDEGALYEIGCFQKALELLPEHSLPDRLTRYPKAKR